MNTKITVNGVLYDSIDAMPPEVRRQYDALVAKFPLLAQVSGGEPEVMHNDLGPLHITTTVRKNLVINGHSYDSEAAMSPDARQAYELAMKAAQSDPAKNNEIKVSFQVRSPTFKFGKATGGESAEPPTLQLVRSNPADSNPSPLPIGPDTGEGRMRLLIILAACGFVGLIWLLAKLN